MPKLNTPQDVPQSAAHRLTRWLPLIIILAIGGLIRFIYLPEVAYHGDIEHFVIWASTITTHGLFHFYDPSLRFAQWDRTYPPLATAALGAVPVLYGSALSVYDALLPNPVYIALLKVLPVLCELALIAACYAWLIGRPVLRSVIAGALALSPGLIATSGWWGQYEAVYMLFVVLALIALNHDRPLLAWIIFAFALLSKQPAAVLTPVLLVITFRRYGWRAAAKGVIACGVLCLALFAPFIVTSGLRPALSPYLEAGDTFPYVTNNAWNTWFAAFSIQKGSPVHFEEIQLHDSNLLIGPFTDKMVGLTVFGAYVLFVMARMWRQAPEKREFIWAAAIYFGFFMLPTQVHERYLYPMAILAIIAIAQDRRMALLAVGVSVTYAYNILGVAIPYRTPENDFGSTLLAIPTALLNMVLFIVTIGLTVRPPQLAKAPERVPIMPWKALSSGD